MSTTIADTTLGVAATASHTEAFSHAGHPLRGHVAPRNSSDDDRSDEDTRSEGAHPKLATGSAEDARHFAAAMRAARQRAEDHEADASSEQDADPQKPDAQAEPAAESSLASLFAGRFGGSAVDEAAQANAAAAPPASSRAESLAEHLAERILVSELSAAGQEVRIQPSGNILPDTEICLVRGTDGLLSAVIQTSNPVSFQTLAAAQHDLRSRLEVSEGQPVRVTLRSSAEDDNDPRRRSRGLDLDPLA